MREAVAKAEELVAATPGAVMLQQFKNPANPEIHRRTTAEEIWTDLGGEVDVFVSGVGTGGTITGVGEVLKARRPGCRVVAVEPAGAAVLSGRAAGTHHLPGLGAGFVPEILNRAVIDEVVAVTEEQAVRAQLQLARKEGIAAGMSSGAALHAALVLARRRRDVRQADRRDPPRRRRALRHQRRLRRDRAQGGNRGALMAQTYELRRRSIVKSISWRVFAAIITSCVVYVITGKGDFAAKVGLIDTAVKLLIYFLHERVWDKINYGRVPPAPDYEV